MHRMPYLDGARVSNENITLSLKQTYTTTLYMEAREEFKYCIARNFRGIYISWNGL